MPKYTIKKTRITGADPMAIDTFAPKKQGGDKVASQISAETAASIGNDIEKRKAENKEKKRIKIKNSADNTPKKKIKIKGEFSTPKGGGMLGGATGVGSIA